MAKFCSNCGSALAEGVSFCAECGARIVDSAVSVEPNQIEEKTAIDCGAHDSVLIQDEIAPIKHKQAFLRIYSLSSGMVIANVVLYIASVIISFMYRPDHFEWEWYDNTALLSFHTWEVIISVMFFVIGLICIFMALNIKLKPQTTKAQLSFGIKSSANARALTALAVFISVIGAVVLSGVATNSSEAFPFVFCVFFPIYLIVYICVAVSANKITKEITKEK